MNRSNKRIEKNKYNKQESNDFNHKKKFKDHALNLYKKEMFLLLAKRLNHIN